MSGQPRSLTETDRGKRTGTVTVGAVIQGMVSGDEHRIRSELHLVFEDDSTPGMNPATCSDVDITANFEAIREIDCNSPRDLEISSTGLEAWAEEKSSNAHQRPKVRQPTRCEGNQVEPEILEQSHVFRDCSTGLHASLHVFSAKVEPLFLWNSRGGLRKIAHELVTHFADETFEGVRA
jgi:hypothetical protein